MKRTLRFLLLTVLALVMTHSDSFAQLSGTKTIGGTSPDYTTFTAAISDLTTNGANGDVTFEVRSGTFSESINLGAFTGSGSYDIVFKGTGKTSTILTSASSSGTVRMGGGDNITFRDMEIRNTLYAAIRVNASSDDCNFINCVLKGRNISTTSNTYAIVYFNNRTSQRMTFDSCDFRQGSYGIYSYGSSSVRLKDLVVKNSSFSGIYNQLVYVYYATSPKFLYNTFTGGSYIYGESLYLGQVNATATSVTKINGNKFIKSADAAIYAYAVDGYSSTVRNEMFNNVIQGDFTSTSPYPCYMSSSDRWNIYHNTIAMNVNYTSTLGANIYLGSANNIDLQNNTFIRTSGGYYLYGTSTSATNEAYNNFYANSGTPTYTFGGSSSAASTSVNVHQGWASLSDLKTKDGCVNGANLTSTVSEDINGNTRNNPPDIGAFEVSSGNNDAGVVEITSPSTPLSSGSQTVTLKIKNFGANNISSVTLGYKVGTSTAVTQTFTLSSTLAPCDETSLTFTTGFSVSSGCYDFKAWTASPNSNTDPNNTNDTATSRLGVGASGTFKVGGSGADFSNIGAALTFLECTGVSGPVTFNVASGTYSGRIVVPNISGASSSNTITFNGAGKTSTILTNSVSSSTAPRSTLEFAGSKYVTFKNMTIRSTGSSYGWAMQFNGSENCGTNNCILSVATSSSTNVLCVTNTSSGTSYSSGVASIGNTIDSCDVIGGSRNIMFWGLQNLNTCRGITISNSNLTKAYYQAIYFYATGGQLRIQNNNFSDFGSTTPTAAYISSGYYNSGYYSTSEGENEISGNNVQGCYSGFQIYSHNNSEDFPGLFFNNTISCTAGNGYQGLYLSGSSYPNENWKVYHNTIVMSGTGTQYAMYAYHYNGGMDTLDVRNNIFEINKGTGYPYYVTGNVPNGTSNVRNYNDYFNNTGTNLIYNNGTNVNASGLGSISNADGNSVNVKAPFVSRSTPTNLHLTDACFATGTSISTIVEDRDGDARSSSDPHLGSDEIPINSLDIGVTSIASPNGSVTKGKQTVKVVVSNFGVTDVDSFKMHYQVGAGSVVSQSVSLSSALGVCESDTFTFTTTFTLNLGCTKINAWTSKPNGSGDDEASNDSTTGVDIGVGLSGPYTIGGPSADFSDINDALSKLQCAGVTGPVIFNLAADTISGQLKFAGSYNGTSDVNTITFNGPGRDKFLIKNNVTSSVASRSSLLFDGASHIIMRNMTIEAAGSSYGWAVHFKGTTVGCGINNCDLKVAKTTSSNVNAVVFSSHEYYYYYASNSKNCFVDSSNISGGYSGAYIYGATSAGGTHQNVRFADNKFFNNNQYGIYAFGCHNVHLLNNHIDMSASTSTSHYGLYVYYLNGNSTTGTDSSTISGNIIPVIGRGGIFVYYSDNSSSNRGLISNNMIGGTAEYTSTTYGLYLYYADNWNVYNNTVSMATTGGSGSNYGAYVYQSSNYSIMNNIFSVTSTTAGNYGYAFYSNYFPSATRYHNYNVYDNANRTYLMYAGGARTQANLNTYNSTGAGADTSSIARSAPFKSNSDLHLLDACFDRGMSFTEVPNDVDGESRNSSGPHIGADEVPTATLDAGVATIMTPNGSVSSGSQTVKVIVRNFGLTSLSSVDVSYQVGSGTPVKQSFTLSPSLPSCEQDTLTFTNTFTHTKGCGQLTAWTSKPNSSTDGISTNDTSNTQFGVEVSGTLTVGGTTPDFPTLNAAIDELRCTGVSGAVTINVRSGTYNEQVMLTGINGLSAANTLTIQSDPSNKSMPKFVHSSVGIPDNYVFQFGTESHITVKGLHLQNKGGSYSYVVFFPAATNNISFVDCKLEGPKATTSTNNSIVYAYRIKVDTVTFNNCDLLNGSISFYTQGLNTSPTSGALNNWKIDNCRLTGFHYRGIYAYYHNNLNFTNNDVSTNGNYANAYGMYNYYCQNATRVTGNKFHSFKGGYGIYQYQNSGTSSNPAIYANNFISIGDGSTARANAFESRYSRHQKFYHNSCYNNSSSPTSSTYATIYTYHSSSGYAGNEFVNNNVVNGKGGYTMYFYSTSHGWITSNYNNLYNGATSNLVWSSNGSRASLAAHRSATGDDANSYSVNPIFTSATDLHAASSVLDSAGTALTAVTIDIDGQTRRSPGPSIGADEYTAIDNDAGITAILSPSIICTSNSAQVTMKNFGNLNLTGVTINWTVNGVAQTAYNWSHSGSGIAQGASVDVTLGTFSAPTGSGPVSIVAWTTNPNTRAEINTDNDTASADVGRGMSGTFTIAATGDYTNFGDAIADLHARGLCGPVVFNVEEGTYNEQVNIPAFVGSNPTNTVTFQADKSNTKDVVVTGGTTSYLSNYVVQLNGSSNIVFDGINMTNTGGNSTYTTVLKTYRPSATDFCRNIIVKNSTLTGKVSTYTGEYAAIVSLNRYNYSGYPDYNKFEGFTIDNCQVLNGGQGVYAEGITNFSNQGKNLNILNSTFMGQYYRGVYVSTCDTVTFDGNSIESSSAYSQYYGIYVISSFGGMEFNDNSIMANGGTSTCYGGYFNNVKGGMNAHNNNVVAAGGSGTANGMYLTGLGNTTDTNTFVNNFFSASKTGVSSQVGFNCWYAGPTNFFYNNCNSESGTNGNNNGTGAFIYGTSTSLHGPYWVGNNNFRSGRTGNDAGWIWGGKGAYCDYNNYEPVQHIIQGFRVTTLATAQAMRFDSNSVAVDPCYTTNEDLHVNNANLHERGLDFGIAEDIDGDTRDNPPTIGAHEINPDLSIVSVSVDTACGHERANGVVTVTIKNNGDIILKDIPLGISVDGKDTTDVVAGPIAIGATGTFVLPKTIVMNGYSDFNVKIWSNNPDVDRSNDTASTTVPYWPLPVNSFTHADTCFKATTKFTNTSTISSGSIVSYGWDFSGGNTSNATNPTHMFASNGTYNVRLNSTSDNGCVDTTHQDVRIMTELVPGSISADQTICYDFAPTALNSTSGASQSAGSYGYQWQSSSDDATWTDISGATSANYAPGQLTKTIYYRREATTSIGCGPKYTASVKITVYDQLKAGSVGSAQDICYNTVPAPLTSTGSPTGGDGTWTYRWESSTDNAAWTTITGATGTGYSPVRLNTTTYFRRIDVGGSNCGEVTTASIKVNVYDPVNGGVAGPSHESCPDTKPNQLGSFIASSGGDGVYTYQWEMSTDKTTWTTITGATSETYQHGLLNKTTHFRRVTTSGSGCGSDNSDIATVSMAAVPNANFVVSNHCFNDVMPLTNFSKISRGSITSYNWDMGDGSKTTVQSPKHVYSTDGTKTVKLLVKSNIGCLDSTEKTVKVSNIPAPAFSSFYDCNSDSLKFKNTTSVNCGKINAFVWDFGDGNSSSMQNPTHRYAKSGSYQVKMKIFLPGGFIDSVTTTVEQFGRSTADFTVQDVCFGENVKFANSSKNATAYEWDFDDNNLSKLAGPQHFYRVIGVYKVKLKAYDGNGCFDEATATVTVKVKPVAYFTTDNRCDGDSVPFFNGTTYANTYSWNFGDAKTSTDKDPKHMYGTHGKYDVTLYAFNNNGCKDTTYGNVEVYDNPTASFTGTDACDGEKVTFKNTSSIVYKHNWTFGDGQTSTVKDPSHVYSKAGTYTVGLNVVTADGCEDATSQSITVYDNPVADFDASEACHGTATSFTNNSTLAAGAMTYAWDFGDGNSSITQSPSHTYASSGSYTVKLTVSAPGGCTNAMSKTVKVNVQPTASFTATTECAGSATSFTNGSTNGTSYSWNFGDGNGSSMSDPSHTYTNAGSYTVTLKTMHVGGCESTTSSTVTVNAVPDASISASTECQGDATVFSNNTTVGSGTLTYAWDFGDGNSSTAAAPSHTYASAGNYVAILTASANGCSDKASVKVAVNANPIVDFKSDNVCIGNTTSFTNLSTGAATYTWNFGDASSSGALHPTHKYASANTYTVQLTGTTSEGCLDSKSASTVVYAKPTVGFSQSSVCVGTSMIFSNTSSAGNSMWNFGDGYTSSTTSPSHTYTKSGSFNVNLKVTNGFGCSEEVTKSVSVYAEPSAGFTASDVCQGSSVAFANTSTGASTYSWDFGDTRSSSATSPSHLYAASGTYTVVLEATSSNGCKSTYSSKVTVNANPTATFIANNPCLGEAVNFVNSSSTGAYEWNFGDGSVGKSANPSHMYAKAGTYNVSLKVSNGDGCSATFNRVVRVNALPTAGFTSKAECTGPEASFTNTSSGASSYAWNFGDGNSSTQMAPSHMFANSGSYTVKLTATTTDGCSASSTGLVTVYNAAKADFSAAGVCDGNAVTFNNMSTGAVSSSWKFGDANSSTDVFPSHTYASAGSYNVSLEVQNGIGCTNTVSKSVSVYSNPTASFTAANGCEGDAFTFTNTSTGASSSAWSYGDGNGSTGTDGSHTYSGDGSRTISLMVTSSNGCTDETSQTIQVYERPFAAFAISNTCEGDLTRFINTSLNGASYSWKFGDGNSSSIENPTHQYSASGAVTASLTVNNANCSDTYNLPFTINAAPDAGFNFTQAGRDVSFTANATTDVSTYEWDFNDGTGSSEANPLHSYNKAVVQNFNVCLRVTDVNGCAAQSCDGVNIDILGAKDLKLEGLAVYPNPTKGLLNINVGQLNGDLSIEIIDMIGNKVRTVATDNNVQNYSVDLSDLAEGVYLVKVINGQYEATERVILSK